MLIFLFGFTILLMIVADYYLIPALKAWQEADKADRAKLTAYARLVMVLLLLVLFGGMVLTLRLGRRMFPTDRKRAVTKYTDIWSEAGKRARPLPDENDEKNDADEQDPPREPPRG